MDIIGKLKEDIKLSDETDDDIKLAKKLKEGLDKGRQFIGVILTSMGIEKLIECKEV